jgi:L-threonylcarbamoyladenylate synthase
MSKEVQILKNKGVGIIPTDTMYGIVGSALSEDVVERIYKLKERDAKKPFIILISSMDDIETFKIDKEKNKQLLNQLWPGKISIILPCPYEEFSYLHRGQNKVAFRLPDKKDLLEILKETGPLVAPSANYEGMEPARTSKEAKKYFGDKIDFYLDGGKIESLPSTLVEIDNGKLNILRQGSAFIN